MPTLKTVPGPLSRPRAFGSRATRAWLPCLGTIALAPGTNRRAAFIYDLR